MRSVPTGRSERATWLLLAVVGVVGAVAVAHPALRSPVLGVAAPASVLLVVVGMAVHRVRSVQWLMATAMLALWATGTVLVQVNGSATPIVGIVVGLGQAVATALALLVVWTTSRHSDRPRDGSPVDLVIIATVLGLVGAQLVAAATMGSGGGAPALVVPTLDVMILGMLLRFGVSRRLSNPSAVLALTGSVLTIAYDLTSAVQGQRLALPGQLGQVLGTVCVLVLGLAAVHPSMRTGLSPEAFMHRRRASTSLLGLTPLVVVPIGLWAVAQVTSTPGLPPWMLLVGGAVVAGLCLVRAAEGLRASEHIAEHDPLTDLANRRGLARAYARMPSTRGTSVILIDVDEFKQVNDTHGHDVGDALLLQVRDRLLDATLGTGVVARLGGDEFVVLTPVEQEWDVADRVLRALRTPTRVGDLLLRTSASIGIASASAGTSLPELLTRADIAMYAAKAGGRDRVEVFEAQMRIDVARRFALTGEVRQLLGGEVKGVGYLEVHFQPLVDLRTGEAVGAEALVRWRHPQHGLLAPDAFLGVVSSSGLDAALDAAVLADVLAQLVAWREEGRRSLPISVNLTRDSLDDPTLADRILGALVASGVPSSQLHVEITEHEELPEDGPAARSLQALAAAGVATHLDDYGTGYTSLDYLRRFPIEVLKLDRAVVTTLDDDRAQLVAGVAAMAAALDLDVLAEGVETVEQQRGLVRLGVRFGQGYLFWPPLAPETYADDVLGGPSAATPVSPFPSPRSYRPLTV